MLETYKTILEGGCGENHRKKVQIYSNCAPGKN